MAWSACRRRPEGAKADHLFVLENRCASAAVVMVKDVQGYR